jgi:hypothetical protein
VDEQTPLPKPTPESTPQWYTRPRDLWWSLNQAAVRLVRERETTVRAECGNSQPFFRGYYARINEGDWTPVDASFVWNLVSGSNRLEVVSEDDYGRRGASSMVVVDYRPEP